MDALQHVDHPGYAALLLRRTLPDLALPGALMHRSHAWFANKDVHWDGKNRIWTFPSGASISFGFLEHDADQYRYQSSEFHFIGFDEGTQFEENQYRYLFSRLRRKVGMPFKPKMRMASNPGGVGHEWVKQRFIIEGPAKGRVFIPASLYDNPHIDQVSYEQALDELDPITRAQLLLGDWDARHGGSIFDRSWFERLQRVPQGLRIVRYWDLAATAEDAGKDPDWTVGTLLGVDSSRKYYVLDVKRIRGTPRQVEDLIFQTACEDGKDVPVYIEQEPGSSGVNTIDHYVRRVLNGFAVKGNRTSGKGGKLARARPFSAQAQKHNVALFQSDWNTTWLDELEAFPNARHDDQVDSASGAFEMIQTQGWFQDAACFEWLAGRGEPGAPSLPAWASSDIDIEDIPVAGSGGRFGIEIEESNEPTGIEQLITAARSGSPQRGAMFFRPS